MKETMKDIWPLFVVVIVWVAVGLAIIPSKKHADLVDTVYVQELRQNISDLQNRVYELENE